MSVKHTPPAVFVFLMTSMCVWRSFSSMILVTLGYGSGLERLFETTVGLWVRIECEGRGGEGKDVNKESLVLSIIFGESLLS